MTSHPQKSSTTPLIRSCSQCGQHNRIPPRYLADRGKCGQCKAELGPVSEPIDVDSALFREIVNSVRVPVLVDFWAAWCGPCRMAAPHVRRVAELMAGRVVVLKVDTESNPELAGMFQIQGIPNFVVLKHGEVVLQRAGLVQAAELQRWLEEAETAP